MPINKFLFSPDPPPPVPAVVADLFERMGIDDQGLTDSLPFLMEEAGEVAKAVRVGDPTNIAEELADVAIIVHRMAQVAGIDLDTAIRDKAASRLERHQGDAGGPCETCGGEGEDVFMDRHGRELGPFVCGACNGSGSARVSATLNAPDLSEFYVNGDSGDSALYHLGCGANPSEVGGFVTFIDAGDSLAGLVKAARTHECGGAQ